MFIELNISIDISRMQTRLRALARNKELPEAADHPELKFVVVPHTDPAILREKQQKYAREYYQRKMAAVAAEDECAVAWYKQTLATNKENSRNRAEVEASERYAPKSSLNIESAKVRSNTHLFRYACTVMGWYVVHGLDKRTKFQQVTARGDSISNHTCKSMLTKGVQDGEPPYP